MAVMTYSFSSLPYGTFPNISKGIPQVVKEKVKDIKDFCVICGYHKMFCPRTNTQTLELELERQRIDHF